MLSASLETSPTRGDDRPTTVRRSAKIQGWGEQLEQLECVRSTTASATVEDREVEKQIGSAIKTRLR